jgi:hypothetical protein
MQCLNCNKELKQTSTKPAKYCSDACRMAFKRKNKDYTILPVIKDKQCPSVELNKRRENEQRVCSVSPENEQIPNKITNKVDSEQKANKVDLFANVVIPPCPRGTNQNVWTLQHLRKAGAQFKGRA